MRLYLSSYLLGDHPEELSTLIRGNRRGWVIANALDGLDETRRRRDTEDQIADLAALGLAAHDFDLREHDPASISRDFGSPDFIWVRSGNVFTLRAAMARSGADVVIVRALRRDAFVYAGYSAGACVLAPSLSGLELCDSVDEAGASYPGIMFNGLGILDRPVVPHLSSPGHPETGAVAEVAARYDREQQQYWALRDGQALLINGSNSRVG